MLILAFVRRAWRLHDNPLWAQALAYAQESRQSVALCVIAAPPARVPPLTSCKDGEQALRKVYDAFGFARASEARLAWEIAAARACTDTLEKQGARVLWPASDARGLCALAMERAREVFPTRSIHLLLDAHGASDEQAEGAQLARAAGVAGAQVNVHWLPHLFSPHEVPAQALAPRQFTPFRAALEERLARRRPEQAAIFEDGEVFDAHAAQALLNALARACPPSTFVPPESPGGRWPFPAAPHAVSHAAPKETSADGCVPSNIESDGAREAKDEGTELAPGESGGLAHWNRYLECEHKPLARYKETRNALMAAGDAFSRLSRWLSVGALSPRRVMNDVLLFEREHGGNDSTRWLIIELLWRDFFLHQARELESAFFGQCLPSPETQGDAGARARFEAWRDGATEVPFVNAMMRELRLTGFLSNRARQIAASALVRELNVPWQWGAAWFEHCLLDHCPAANGGNWRYVAGEQFDPRGGRHFDLGKQERIHDPEQLYQKNWLS